MKIWVTRSEIPTCISKGITQCTIWLKKPFFDTTPRGPEAGRLYKDFPLGWRVLDDDGLDATGPLHCPVGDLFEGHAEGQALWNAISLDITGELPGDDWVDRFDAVGHGYVTDENFVDGWQSFLHEADVSPALWFRIALYNGFEHETAGSRQFREQMWYAQQDQDMFF